MGRRSWQVTVHWVSKESDTAEGLSTPAHTQDDEGVKGAWLQLSVGWSGKPY